MPDIFDILTYDEKVIKADIDITAYAPDWQNLVTLNTSRATGNYEVNIALVWNYDISRKSGKFRWSVDGGTTWLETSEEPKDKTDLRPFSIVFPVNHAGGARQILLEAARENDTHTMTIKYVAVSYKRVG
jgi:hypothetical protein